MLLYYAYYYVLSSTNILKIAGMKITTIFEIARTLKTDYNTIYNSGNSYWRNGMKKYFFPLFMLTLFETVAITLWLTKNNLFYLFNFSYIGISLSLGIFLYLKEYKYARRIAQLLVGL